jgi:serine/threonine-protein kinase RsbW
MPTPIRGLLLFVLVGAGYVLGYKLASEWFSAEDQGASFFPAAGVTLAALVLVPRRQWPIVLAAAATAEFFLDLSGGSSALASAGYTLANVAQPLAGALLLTAVVARPDLRRTRDLAAFIGCAVLFAPVVGAAIAALTWSVVDDRSGWARFAFEWWSGDGLGILVVAGALLSLRFAPRLAARRIVEGALLAGLAIAATAVVFEFGWFEFVYLPVALLVVLAFRVGTTGVAVTSAVVAFVAAGATAEAQDFWQSVDISPANRILYLQLALGIIIASVLALAAEIAGRERIAVELARSESEREAAVERAALAEREQRARIHAESLGRSAALFARTATVPEVAESAAAVLSEWGADQAAFYVVDGEQLIEEAASGPDEGLREPALEAVRAGAPVVSHDEAATLAAFPVIADRTVKGVLTARLRKPEWLTEDRNHLLATLADQAAVALERARLQTQADAAAEDAALLAHLGVVLEQAIGMEDRARALVRALSGERAHLAVVHALDEDGNPRLIAKRRSGSGPELDDGVLAEVAAAALASDSVETRQFGELRLLAVPLRARSRALGVLSMGADRKSSARLTSVLMQRVGTRAALALDNALLYEQERDVSHSLQLGLLGGDPPVTPETAIATAYRPGSAALEVGGDWYDTFTLPDGRLVLLVGDVVGHGLEAAVAMGQLRGAVRALAPLGSPREVLEGLDLFVEQLPAATMATLAYAELDPRSGSIVYACAGHPPPLVLPDRGKPRLTWEGRSAPLGSSFGTGREEAADRLFAGDTIVLYTDGLVEHRTEGIARGLDALLAVAESASGSQPSHLVDRILDALLEEQSQDDDVCVLAVRLLARPLRFVHSFPAAPAEVSGMRRALATWLEQLHLDPVLRQDAVLAVSEAAANAAEHAYDFDGQGIVRVEAWVSDGELHLSIHDHGAWNEQHPDRDRGRGRMIMEALMRNVTIEPGDGGTIVRMSLPIRDGAPV